MRRVRRATMAVLATTLSLLTVLPITQSSAQSPYEPNDSRDRAYGWLAGATDYESAIETTDDVDWFKFRTTNAPSVQVAMSFTGLTPGCDNTNVYLYNPDGSTLTYDYFGYNLPPLSIRRTLMGNAEYAFTVSRGGVDCTYRFRIDPADAVTANPPATTPPEEEAPENEGPPATDERGIACNTALRDVNRWQARVERARQKLRSAKTRQARARWRNRVRLNKASLKEARRRAREYC